MYIHQEELHPCLEGDWFGSKLGRCRFAWKLEREEEKRGVIFMSTLGEEEKGFK